MQRLPLGFQQFFAVAGCMIALTLNDSGCSLDYTSSCNGFLTPYNYACDEQEPIESLCPDGVSANACSSVTCWEGGWRRDPDPDGTSCQPSNECAITASCQSGVCVDEPTVTCDESEVCIQNICYRECRAPLGLSLFAAGLPEHLVIADLNGDGASDLAVIDNFYWTVSIILNAGGKVFATRVDYHIPGEVLSMAAGDLNGDGMVDLVVGGLDPSSFGFAILRNGGFGTFPTVDLQGSGERVGNLVVADINGDGKLDLATGSADRNTISLWLNDGTATFASKVDQPIDVGASSMVAADFNSDGFVDLALTHWNSGVSVLFNQGGGAFAASLQPISHCRPGAIAADVNNDGKMDLVVPTSKGIVVLLNQGNEMFGEPLLYALDSQPTAIAAGDMNADGHLDLALAHYTTNSMNLLLNRSDGTFDVPILYHTGRSPISITAGDLDGDGSTDLALTNRDENTVELFFNACLRDPG